MTQTGTSLRSALRIPLKVCSRNSDQEKLPVDADTYKVKSVAGRGFKQLRYQVAPEGRPPLGTLGTGQWAGAHGPQPDSELSPHCGAMFDSLDDRTIPYVHRSTRNALGNGPGFPSAIQSRVPVTYKKTRANSPARGTPRNHKRLWRILGTEEHKRRSSTKPPAEGN